MHDLDRRLDVQRGRCGPGGSQEARSRSSSSSSRRSSSSWLRRRRARYSQSGYTAGRSRALSTSANLSGGRIAEQANEMGQGLDLDDLRAKAESLQVWTDKHVVFTGVLRQMQRYQAECLAECLGATCQHGVSRKTNLVVIGELDQRTVAAERTQSVKEEEARRRVQDGQAIEFLTEDEFLQLFANQTSCQGL